MTNLSRLQQENAQLNRQVTDVQRRCTELLEEKRRANVDYAVREFHLKYGHPAPAELTILDEKMIRFRLRLVAEEFLELVEATFKIGTFTLGSLRELIETAPVHVNLPEFMDATHDLDYVVAGTRVAFGYDGAPGAAEVHRSNMAKIPNGLGKPTKPEGWTPPDIAGVLRAQGWGSPRFEARENPFVRRMREIPIELNAEEQAKVDKILENWKKPSPADLRREEDLRCGLDPEFFAAHAKIMKRGGFVPDPLSPDASNPDMGMGDCAGPVFPSDVSDAARDRVAPYAPPTNYTLNMPTNELSEKGKSLPEMVAVVAGPDASLIVARVMDKVIEKTQRGELGGIFTDVAKTVRDEDTVSLNIEVPDKVDEIFKDWKTPSLGGNGHICSTKACEEEGCEVLHPNACATDPSVDGWRCAKHERKAPIERWRLAVSAFLDDELKAQQLFTEAAKGLRKLAAKYPEMPADGERGYYEMLAEQLEKL